MSIKTILRKRCALYKGEIGFFPSSVMAQEDIQAAKMDSEVMCEFTSPATLEELRFLWALVHKVADTADIYLDKNHAMDDLKDRIGYVKLVYDKDVERWVRKPKSLQNISYESLRSITDQMINVICEEILPGVKPSVLRAEIEEMCVPRTKGEMSG